MALCKAIIMGILSGILMIFIFSYGYIAMKKETFYVTTPIYYVTAKPHLGSLYSTLLADVVARWQKLQGRESFFLTGTDEHGQKVAQAAAQANQAPQDFVDSFIPAYTHAWNTYSISYDTFIRTTDHAHVAGAQAFIKKLLATGAIYKDSYEGWYCTPCETFVTEKGVEDSAPACPSCGRQTIKVAEQTYFFRLSAYQDKLLAFYKEHPHFIVPKERINEVIAFVQSGLKDLSISRTTVKWGVPFPEDPDHTVYVWAEALCNYITAIGYPKNEQMFSKWWPADMHIIGKDIVRFHAVYWPAFLMAAELPLPKQLLVHGWIKVDKQKMSKSLGNVVDPIQLSETYGVDEVRYYLVRQMPVNADGEFGTADLEQRISSELADDLGNLLQRMVMLANKYQLLELAQPKNWSDSALMLHGAAIDMLQEYELHMQESMFHLALARLWAFIHKVNSYFHENEPWKLAKTDPARFHEVMSATAHSLRIIGILLWPVMPKKMAALLDSLGVPFELHNNTIEKLELGVWQNHFLLKQIPILFKKPEGKESMEEVKQQASVPEPTYISIEDVIKVELIVGTIVACEEVAGSDKLVKSQVDFGPLGMRQVLSGIRKYYAPADLIGKQGVFVFNLSPRKMMGLESQGMMLLAKDENGGMKMATVAGPVPNGSRLS